MAQELPGSPQPGRQQRRRARGVEAYVDGARHGQRRPGRGSQHVGVEAVATRDEPAELVPAHAVGTGHVQDALHVALGELDESAGEVLHVDRAAALVLEEAPVGAGRQSSDELLVLRRAVAQDERGARHDRVGTGVEDRALGGHLGLAVGRDRVRRCCLVVGAVGAAEDHVAGDQHHPGAVPGSRARHVGRTVGGDRPVGLDVRRVDDRVGPVPLDQRLHRRGVAHVGVRGPDGDDLVARRAAATTCRPR